MDLSQLIKSTLQGLPLPNDLILRSAESYNNPVTLLELNHQYDNIKNHPAWLHFTGRLLEMKQMIEKGILLGANDKQGNDLTPAMRASYGTILQILAIPGQLEIIQKNSETALIGVPQDNETTPHY